ncbi:AAA family ATPase [Bradyrhizobium barranii]|uniref:ATP-binding protein n=1 Tax=Bradyrhizobium barranii TaxID=2992140 RepID=UPI0024B26A36|nr:AAA family ATPase [Bradyrhizobium barranii]WFT96070.1 AAA family ATPase [Bradyrhizobium barranii]
MRIADWLNAVGLAEYIAAFEANHIDLDQLSELTDADLREIGVIALGHRRTLLKAAKERPFVLTPHNERREYLSFPSERRHLTILFLDIVDSTALATAVDPEDLSDTIGRFQKAAISQINSFGGYVARSFGDGLLAYFGWPRAHEDDPQRAILAADAAHRAIRDLRRPDGRPLFARAGVATGWVVLGDIGGAAKDEVVGETPNLAARLQSVAAPGQTVVASSTAALLGEEFALQDLGPQTLKGFDTDPRAYAIISVKQRARFQARTIRTTPLVGRVNEIELLRDLWSKAKSGQGQMLVLMGEAGIGKTRIIRELLDQIRSDRQLTMRYHCSPYYQNSALRPMIVQLSEAAGFLQEDDSADRLRKLKELLRLTNASDDAVSLIAELLSIPASGHLSPLPLAPIQKRQRTFSALADQFRNLAKGAPVLAIVEDAHWIDPTTAEYLDLIVRSLNDVAALVIVSGRLEYSPPSSWQQLPSSNYCLLKALSDDNSKELAEKVAGASLPARVTEEIASRTDGVPLFVEELTKGLVEGGRLKFDGNRYELTDSPLHLAIPTTLQDSLTARLDNLPESKSIAQIGAALGREFRVDHLAAITGLPVLSVKEQVNGLEAAGLVFGRRAPLDGTYVFKHALVQNASYESLLLTKRKSLHGQIAEVLSTQFPEFCETDPEVIAAHWSRSNSPSKSTALWLRAGQKALKRSAYLEALNNLRHGSEFLNSGTKCAENSRIEFDLNLCTGQASYVINGPAAEQTTRAYSRALELIELVDQPDQRFDLLYGIFSGYHFASKFDLAREPAEKMFEIATKLNDDGHVCQAHRMLGYLDFFEGNLVGAISNFEALASLYRPELHAPMATRYGADSLIAARGFEAVAHGVCGHLDKAQRLVDENVAYARELNHPPSLGWAFAAGGYLNYFLAKPEAALKYVEEGARYCEANNVAVWGIHCRLFETWVKSASCADAASSIEVMRKGIANANSRISLGIPLFRAALADLLLTTEQTESAVQEIDTALSELRSTGQRFFAPSVYYVKGNCSRKLGRAHADDSAAWYKRSAFAAREMQANLLEVRALSALAQVAS